MYKRQQPAPPEEQPEVPTQTGEVHVQDKEIEKSKTTENSKMDKLMEMFLKMSKDNEETSKNLNKKMEGMEEKMDSTNKDMEESSKERKEDNHSPVSYTHLNVIMEKTKVLYSIIRSEPTKACLLYTSRCV